MLTLLTRRIALISVALVAAVLLLSGPRPLLFAQGGTTGMGLNPSRAEVEILPGTEKTLAFEIESPPSNSPVRGRLLLSSTDWTISEDGAVQFPDPGTLPDSASRWIVFSPSAVSISSGQKQMVRVTVSVPEKTSAQDLFAFPLCLHIICNCAACHRGGCRAGCAGRRQSQGIGLGFRLEEQWKPARPSGGDMVSSERRENCGCLYKKIRRDGGASAHDDA